MNKTLDNIKFIENLLLLEKKDTSDRLRKLSQRANHYIDMYLENPENIDEVKEKLYEIEVIEKYLSQKDKNINMNIRAIASYKKSNDISKNNTFQPLLINVSKEDCE